MSLRRGPWVEAELRGDDGERVMICPGWTNDRDSLVLPLRETGWFDTTREAWDAAETAHLYWCWVGETQDRQLALCDPQGVDATTEEELENIDQVTVARIGSSP